MQLQLMLITIAVMGYCMEIRASKRVLRWWYTTFGSGANGGYVLSRYGQLDLIAGHLLRIVLEEVVETGLVA